MFMSLDFAIIYIRVIGLILTGMFESSWVFVFVAVMYTEAG